MRRAAFTSLNSTCEICNGMLGVLIEFWFLLGLENQLRINISVGEMLNSAAGSTVHITNNERNEWLFENENL